MTDPSLFNFRGNYPVSKKPMSMKLNYKLHKPFGPLKQKKYPGSRNNLSIKSDSAEVDISIVGFSKLFDRSYPLRGKLVWLIALVAMSGLCSWQLWISTDRFLKFPLIKDVNIERSATVKLPAIYLCPGFFRNLYQAFTTRSICLDNCTIDGLYEKIALSIVFKQMTNFESMWRRTSPPYFSGVISSNDVKVYEPCSSTEESQCQELGQELTDISTIITPSFWGGCLMINTSIEMLYKGIFSSLTVVFHNRFHEEVMTEYMNIVNNKTDIEILNEHRIGAMISLHDVFEDNKHHELFFKTQEILQGFETNIQIQRKEFRKRSVIGKPCKSSGEVDECHFKCITQQFEDLNLPCRFPFIKLPLRICNTSDKFVDILQTYFKTYSKFRRTDCGCSEKCDEVSYSGSADVVDTIDDLSKVQVNLFFADNTYEIIKEERAYSSEAYLSDIGGNLGFFLGFSLLTAVEIAELFKHMINTTCKKFIN